MVFRNLKTERMILKSIGTEDRDFIFSQFSDDVVNRYLFDAEPLTNVSGADDIINFYTKTTPQNQHRWILIRKSDNEKMGTCGFHCWDKKLGKVDIGYDLKEVFWGNGYMLEAIKEIIEIAKCEMNIKEISACIYIDNLKSINLVKKLGFNLTGSSHELFRDKKYPHNIYSLYITDA